MASPVIQFKRGAFANLPGLQAGEPALTTDTYELYVGINSTTGGNKFFGSHRYWTRETSSVGSRVNLVEGTSNGSDFVSLKSPDSLAGIVTFTMPGSDGSNGHVLITDGSGNLSFSAPAASSFTLAADVGSNDTFNTGETLTFTGGTGIEATVSNNQISYGLDAQLVDIAGLTPSDGGIIIGDGSNFVVESGATARASLGVDAAGVDNSTDVTLAGSYDYLTLSGQQITLGQVDLSTDVTGTLTTTTVNVTNVKANDGTAAITITDSTGAVEMSQNLTVQGNLIVNGSTTQVNTTQTTIEDQLLELGMVDGSAPSSDLNKDIGMLFNYYTSSAKKAGVYWDDSAARIAVASDVSETSGVLTASAYAALEIGSLWVNDCAGQSQVINCSGSERTLENITVDGGTF